jgi:hypothetical protein
VSIKRENTTDGRAPALGTAQQPINLTGNSPFPPATATLANTAFPQQFNERTPQQQQLQQILNLQAQQPQQQQQQQPQIQQQAQQQSLGGTAPPYQQMHQNLNAARPPQARPAMLSKDKFFDSLNALFNRNGMKPVEPKVEGRGVDLYALYNLVNRAGGSKQVAAGNGWPLVAGQMGWAVPGSQPPRSTVEVGNALARVFAELLGDFEVMYARLMQTQDTAQPFTQMRPPDAQVNNVSNPANPTDFIATIAAMPIGQIQSLGLSQEQLRLVQQHRVSQQPSPQLVTPNVQAQQLPAAVRPPMARPLSQTMPAPAPASQIKNTGALNAQQLELARAMIASIEQSSRQSMRKFSCSTLLTCSATHYRDC